CPAAYPGPLRARCHSAAFRALRAGRITTFCEAYRRSPVKRIQPADRKPRRFSTGENASRSNGLPGNPGMLLPALRGTWKFFSSRSVEPRLDFDHWLADQEAEHAIDSCPTLQSRRHRRRFPVCGGSRLRRDLRTESVPWSRAPRRRGRLFSFSGSRRVAADRVVVEDRRQPAFRLGQRPALPAGIVLGLVAFDLADAEIVTFRM